MPLPDPLRVEAAIAACHQAHTRSVGWLIFDVPDSKPYEEGYQAVEKARIVETEGVAKSVVSAIDVGAGRTKPKELFGGAHYQAFLMAEEDATLEGLKKVSIETKDKTVSWVLTVEFTPSQKTAREPWFAEQRSRASKMAAVLRDLTTDKRPDPAALVAIGFPKKDD